MARSTEATITITESKLEALIRRIVREELERILQRQPELVEAWMSDPDYPLYQEMVALRDEIRAGELELLGDEMWGK